MVRRKARIRRKLPIAKTLRPVSFFPSSAPENPWLRNSGKSDIMEYTYRFFLRGQTNWCLSLRLQVSCHCETSPQTGRGNPPVRGEMYRKVPGRMGVAAIFGGNRHLVPFNRGIATPVCALARNDSVFRSDKQQFTFLPPLSPGSSAGTPCCSSGSWSGGYRGAGHFLPG